MLTIPRTLLTLGACAALANQPRAQSPSERPQIIAVHLHAYDASQWKVSQPNPVAGRPGPATADEHMRQTLAAMERHNIVKAIVSGPLEIVERWRTAAPARILASPLCGRPNVDFSAVRGGGLTRHPGVAQEAETEPVDRRDPTTRNDKADSREVAIDAVAVELTGY
jgi:hypothetical protein